MTDMRPLATFASIVGRGITPRYATDGSVLVFNQKCVRDGSVRTVDARRHDGVARTVPITKRLAAGDILVNSTGQGTLGRTGYFGGSDDDATVDSHITIIRPNSGTDPRWLSYVLRLLEPSIEDLAQGSTGQTELPREGLAILPIPSMRFREQQAIAEVLGALDDKIAANTALATTAASVASTALRVATRDEAVERTIDEATSLLTRGITPRYVGDGEGTRVLNQKCVRDQVVSLDASRWTDDAKVKPEKILAVGDVLVNSTGQGTLGRVARWTSPGRVTVDSHITILRPDPSVSDPTVIGQAILAIEAGIEALGEGSTGQTELGRAELGRARIRFPNPERAENLGTTLRSICASQDAARAENRALAATRDALLPQLMSGKLRVRDAEVVASEAGV